MDNRNIRKEESAVSPVIGVILMVAITVILAAVIGAFVFGMGTPEKTPAANVEITAANAATDTITLEHRGGDDLAVDDIKVIVTSTNAAGTTETLTCDPACTEGYAFSAGQVMVIGTDSGNESVTVGGQDTTPTIPTSDGFDMLEGKVVEVQFWYNPTGQRIAVISRAISA